MRAKTSRTELLSRGCNACTRVWGVLASRVATTGRFLLPLLHDLPPRPCVRIYIDSPLSSPPSASLYLFISVYFTSSHHFPSRTSLPSTSRRAPCDPDCYDPPTRVDINHHKPQQLTPGSTCASFTVLSMYPPTQLHPRTHVSSS